LSQNDEETDAEEEKTEKGGVEVGGTADLPATKLHLDLEDAAARPH
jgi:hypothetical protein